MTNTEIKYYEIKKMLLDIVKKYEDDDMSIWDDGYYTCAIHILKKMNENVSVWGFDGEKK